jgi:hypothetical protein
MPNILLKHSVLGIINSCKILSEVMKEETNWATKTWTEGLKLKLNYSCVKARTNCFGQNGPVEGSCEAANGKYYLLRCDAVYCGGRLSKLRRNIQSSGFEGGRSKQDEGVIITQADASIRPLTRCFGRNWLSSGDSCLLFK